MTARAYALVTGGSSGIGLAVALALRARGLDVVILARDPARLAAAQAQLAAAPCACASGEPSRDIEAHAVDVGDRAALRALAQALLARRGAPEWLVTSAGVAHPDHFDVLQDAQYDEAMRINYFGTLDAVRAFAPAMAQARRGHVVLLSSAAGLVGIWGYAAYAPSKFAVRGLAEVLRAELRPRGVSVHVVCPPDVDTPQLAQENRTKPAQTRAIGEGGGLLDAATVAQAVVQGVMRGRFMIAPGAQATALAWLHSLIAPVLRWSFDRAADRVSGDAAARRDGPAS